MIEDLAPRQVWEGLMSNPASVLCDVRTNAEWSFVGLPDLTQTGKQPVLIQWQVFPSMQPNPKFLEALAQAGVKPEDLFNLPLGRAEHGLGPGGEDGGV
jgi:hypothetical protein